MSPMDNPKKMKIGRPVESQRTSFINVTGYLEDNDNDQITVLDLVRKMEEFISQSDECTPYSSIHTKKLLEHFEDKNFITQVKGKADVTFRSTASSTLHEFYAKPAAKDNNNNSSKLYLLRVKPYKFLKTYLHKGPLG